MEQQIQCTPEMFELIMAKWGTTPINELMTTVTSDSLEPEEEEAED